MLFCLSGLAGNLIFKYQPLWKAALPDMFLCIKFWLSIYVGRFLWRKLDTVGCANNIFIHIKLVTWVYTALIIADNIWPIFNADIRYGFRSTQLFYEHPTVFAACCVLLLVILLTINGTVKGGRVYLIWLSLLMCSSLRSKMLGLVMTIWLIYYFVCIRKKRFRLRTLLMVVPAVLVLGWSQIEYYFFSDIQSGSARYQLLVKSLLAAKDHFPIGAGFGTYGSHFSGVCYSPLYAMYGISKIQGLVEGATYFVSDSYWPMVIAQMGWLGMAAMLAAILVLFFKIQALRQQNRWHYAAGLVIMAYLMIESAASSAFVHPLSMPLALWLGYLLGGLKNNNDTERKAA